ncbi:hypothetical protein NP493_1559g00035 [Ridgeia piscesae]|uniref:Amiloride-sensitive sodium channel n=1 Tax=Ridgeia piscesae TaxID=27915 RepID=A0AAD9JYV5_RIDPI|nr:hypothetical protein NP493_1559g00035 [Ridgeia piscesae]
MAVREVLDDFASKTTMHGIPNVIGSLSTLSRCFWSLICIAAGVMVSMQMTVLMTRYFAYPKKVTVEVVPTPVPFPAISICNMRNLDCHILNMLNRKFIADHQPINHVNTSSDPFVRDYMTIVAKYAPLWYLDEFIVNCHFGGKNCDRARSFVRFFDPYYFNCFTYTSETASLGEHPKHLPLSEGIENGWSSIVFSGNGMLDRNKASEGVRVVVHPPDTEPFPFAEGFDVPPGFSASFGVRPRKNVRIGEPYGRCHERNPFETESGTGRRRQYRGIACQKMCLQSHIIRKCNCSDASLPTLPGTKVASCRQSDAFPTSCMHEASIHCLNKCRCYPPCSEVFYDISYSLSKWPAGGYEGDAAYFDVFHVERFRDRFLGTPKYNIVSEYFTDKTREQGMKDFARLNVYIADSSVVITTETPDYLSTQLVSDIGGQLGLWVGISVITLAEVFQLAFSLIRYVLSAERRQLRFGGGGAAGSDVTQKKDSNAGLENGDATERRQFLEKFDVERYQNRAAETPGKLDESRYGQVYEKWDVNR